MPKKLHQCPHADSMIFSRLRRIDSHFQNQIVSLPRLPNGLRVGESIVEEESRPRQKPAFLHPHSLTLDADWFIEPCVCVSQIPLGLRSVGEQGSQIEDTQSELPKSFRFNTRDR
ncbi:MAG: hypothetical protein M3463_02740 [Verrucomicrobiota bacterium]|nr:hypothetical protein [Verrucomicrobiota bacterium]